MRISNSNYIKRLKSKDEKALDYVVDNYGGLIKAIVNKHINGLNIYEEECINDILLAVWYGIDKYDSTKGDFKNWIGAIAKYKAIGYRRKYLLTLENQNIDDIELKIDAIEIEIQKQELKEDINSLLSNLREKDRKIFKDYYIEDKKANEIAIDLNVKTENIYNRLSRGKKKLKLLFRGN